jgi:hypothetical protein
MGKEIKVTLPESKIEDEVMDDNFIPTVVIFIEDGEVKLVNSDVKMKVLLVEYVDWAYCDFNSVYEFGPRDDPDYAYITLLDAVEDCVAVDEVLEMYELGPNLEEDDEDMKIVVKGKEG